MGAGQGGVDKTAQQLLAEAKHWNGRCISPESLAIARLLAVVENQQARIAALEAARPAHGLPLEGTGPLPLERRGG